MGISPEIHTLRKMELKLRISSPSIFMVNKATSVLYILISSRNSPSPLRVLTICLKWGLRLSNKVQGIREGYGVSRPRSVDWECSWKLEKVVSHSVLEDN